MSTPHQLPTNEGQRPELALPPGSAVWIPCGGDMPPPLRAGISAGVLVTVESADALIDAWEAEAARLNDWREKARTQHQHEWVARYGDVIAAYNRCIGDLRRQVDAATVRQPPQNNDVTDAKRSVYWSPCGRPSVGAPFPRKPSSVEQGLCRKLSA